MGVQFVRVDVDLLGRRDLSALAKLVVATMKTYAELGMAGADTRSKLAGLLGVHRVAVSRAVASLRELGAIVGDRKLRLVDGPLPADRGPSARPGPSVALCGAAQRPKTRRNCATKRGAIAPQSATFCATDCGANGGQRKRELEAEQLLAALGVELSGDLAARVVGLGVPPGKLRPALERMLAGARSAELRATRLVERWGEVEEFAGRERRGVEVIERRQRKHLEQQAADAERFAAAIAAARDADPEAFDGLVRDQRERRHPQPELAAMQILRRRAAAAGPSEERAVGQGATSTVPSEFARGARGGPVVQWSRQRETRDGEVG